MRAEYKFIKKKAKKKHPGRCGVGCCLHMRENESGEVKIVYHVGIQGSQKLGKRVKVKSKG